MLSCPSRARQLDGIGAVTTRSLWIVRQVDFPGALLRAAQRAAQSPDRGGEAPREAAPQPGELITQPGEFRALRGSKSWIM